MLISMCLSSIISKFLLVDIANIIASILLLIIGIFNILVSFFKKRLKRIEENCKVIEFKTSNIHFFINIFLEKDNADINKDLILSFKETIALSLALSLDGISTGLAIGLYGIDLINSFLFILILQILFSYLAIFLSKFFKKERDYSFFSGVSLIIIALFKLIK